MENKDYEIIKTKRKKLNALKKHLKNKFIGIDYIIDNIIDYMGPWYVFPEVYSSPLIINLWGTTGVGKTALVKEISRFLSKPLIEVDVGEFGENSDFADTMYSSFMEFSGQEVILLLDEMQNARTLRGGMEQERNYLRGIWKLLSDGTIQINRFFETSKRSLIKKLKKYRVPNTKEQDKKAKEKINSDYHWDYEDDDDSATKHRYLNIKDIENDVFPPYMMDSIVIFTQLSYQEINNIIREDPVDGKATIRKLIDKSDVSKELNFNKSIVFIAGNLDDLFEFSDDSDPDIDIDSLIKKNKKISLPDIKKILSRYFKPEQIARFGNNHLIYPAFSEKDYNKIINTNLDNLFKKYEEKINILFNYDESVTNLVFVEGVFPTQGVRPIHSTIKGIIERNCQQFLFDLFSSLNNIDLEDNKIYVTFNSPFIVFKYKSNEFKYKIDMKIGNLRKIIVDDKHAVIAAHEAGHAICYILSAGYVPSKLTAFSANSDADGFARITIDPDDHITKEQFFGFIVTALGGRAAEIEFFGEEKLLTGSISDLENASRLIVKYVDKNCFHENSPLYCVGLGVNEDFDYPSRQEYKEIKFKEIATSALEQARKIIRDNKKFVLEITNEMLKKESLCKKDIETIMEKHGIEKYNNYPYLEKIKEHFSEFGIEK